MHVLMLQVRYMYKYYMYKCYKCDTCNKYDSFIHMTSTVPALMLHVRYMYQCSKNDTCIYETRTLPVIVSQVR